MVLEEEEEEVREALQRKELPQSQKRTREAMTRQTHVTSLAFCFSSLPVRTGCCVSAARFQTLAGLLSSAAAAAAASANDSRC